MPRFRGAWSRPSTEECLISQASLTYSLKDIDPGEYDLKYVCWLTSGFVWE
jgi:hypothetical protein